MSFLDKALDIAKLVVPVVAPQLMPALQMIETARKVMDFVAPVVNNVVNNSPLPDDAKAAFNSAYNLGFRG